MTIEDTYLRKIEEIEERLEEHTITELEFLKLYSSYMFLKTNGHLSLAYRLAYSLYNSDVLIRIKKEVVNTKREVLRDDAIYYKNNELVIKAKLYK